MTAAISARQLAVTFAGRGRAAPVRALAPLDLEVARGRIVGVLGPNGSGKTTLLRVLAGLQPPVAGSVEVLGGAATARAVQRRVGYQPEGPLPIGVLSAPEYLAYVGAELGLPDAEADARARRLLTRLDLLGAGRRWIGTFSTGMQKRTALAAALLGDPELLLLDEPTSGLDPFGSELVMQILRERKAAGCAVLMASHHLLEVEALCDEVLVLQGGVLRARGTLDELLATGDRALVLRGLDDRALQELAAAARARGGEVVGIAAKQRHLVALVRRLAGAEAAGHRGDRDGAGA
ncbi:MAG: ABC transporter ATP-binding protein [Planctomycetes bacterium]|nr:ABC transporter ATP-binding protein [Planctomycetota bacterium]